jgi:hypothetical protein
VKITAPYCTCHSALPVKRDDKLEKRMSGAMMTGLESKMLCPE